MTLADHPRRRHGRTALALALCGTLGTLAAEPAALAEPVEYVRRDTWPATLVASRAALRQAGVTAPASGLQLWNRLERDFPTPCDWLQQDAGPDCGTWLVAADPRPLLTTAVERVLAELAPAVAAPLAARWPPLARTDPLDETAALTLYAEACGLRRQRRLEYLRATVPAIVYTRHHNMGGSHYAYTEAQSDAQAERHFRPGAALCVWYPGDDGGDGRHEIPVADPNGVIRDPDVSYDGRRILFSWKKSDRADDYHLYDLDATTREVRQITHGLGVADYEGAYLPDGSLVFNSTRPVQIVDCWWTEVSNLYTCDAQGRGLRRLAFDQVHDNYPTVTADGRLLYTRWEYNDRGQIFPQALFQMNPDGTGQTEFYGNNSWFPTTILHARGLPDSTRVVAIATGHHSRQTGKLVLIDPARGRQEAAGVQLIAPVRATAAERIDAYGQNGELFQYPYPLSDREFLVAYHPTGWPVPGEPDNQPYWGASLHPRFRVCWLDSDGRREVLAADPVLPCNQPVPLRPRPVPRVRPSLVDARRTTGTLYVSDVYAGAGLAGVARGTAKWLRVVTLEYRVAGIGQNGSGGPAGGALSSTPPATGNASWDVKAVLGLTPVREDGSAFVAIPARTPVYLQVLDGRRRMVQSMRSWLTLQPGENATCAGCHEGKNTAPPAAARPTLALGTGPLGLEPFQGQPPRGFSFAREIQPIIDRACVRCHRDRERPPPYRRQAAVGGAEAPGSVWLSRLESDWLYTTEAPPVDWYRPGFAAAGWARGRAGFGQRGTPGGTVNTPWLTPDIWLHRSFDLPANLPAGPFVFRLIHDEDVEIYLNGVRAAAATWFVTAPISLAADPAAAATLKPGPNELAVHCRQTAGGQLIDVGLTLVPGGDQTVPGVTERAFSLLGAEVVDRQAKRRWSDAYLALTQSVPTTADGAWRGQPGDPVSWIHVQSAPPMLPPFAAGSARSRLLDMLEQGHGQAALSAAEMERLACWIDLGVPFCGDYAEANAWSPEELAKHEHFTAKRHALDAAERASLESLATDR